MPSWHLQQINNSTNPTIQGEYTATNGPAAPTGSVTGQLLANVFVSVYNDQQHFAYTDNNANIQDAWYDPSGWHLQQINNLHSGPAIPGEYIATNGPHAAIRGWPFISVYNGQQHFTYVDLHYTIQDAWWDGSGWHLQQINNPNGPIIAGEYIATNGPGTQNGPVFVSLYNGQQHFTYIDINGNIQDAWYDPSAGWRLQQINSPSGPTIPGEYIATNGPGWYSNLFVSVYNDQQHFTYIDFNGNIQDAWYDPSGWRLQQINALPNGPTIAGEYVATTGPAAMDLTFVPLFVSVYNDQQHFTYLDSNANIQDAWYDANANAWNLQQINSSNNPTIPGEYTATNGPTLLTLPGPYTLFVSVYNDQQHFTWIDYNNNIQDAWYG